MDRGDRKYFLEKVEEIFDEKNTTESCIIEKYVNKKFERKYDKKKFEICYINHNNYEFGIIWFCDKRTGEVIEMPITNIDYNIKKILSIVKEMEK